jgi:pimeloyl-ACP methyl ester carboxylesterase
MQCELPNATIRYEVHGPERGKGQPVLLLHGWTMDRRLEIADYEPIFAGRNGYTRIYLDLPGMGQSIAGPGLRNQDDVLEALLGFIDKVIGPERFLLAGTSLGGYLARAIAVKRRGQVAGLLLRVPAVIADTARRTLPPFQPVVRDDALMAGLPADERTALGDVLVQTPGYLESLRPRIHELVEPAIAATRPIAHEIRADPARYAVSFDLAEAEKGFAAPTLIIAGRQDTTVGYRDAMALLESYPRATLAVLDGADHKWPVVRLTLLEALVENWLARIVLSENSLAENKTVGNKSAGKDR